MAYRESLNHWVVVRQMPDMQRSIVARFYRRFLRRASLADADGHQQFLQRHFPNGQYVVMFEAIAS